MGVTYGLLVGNCVRADDGVTIVERSVVVSICTEGKADLLLPRCVTIKVGEEVAYVRFFICLSLTAAKEAGGCKGGDKCHCYGKFVFHKFVIK